MDEGKLLQIAREWLLGPSKTYNSWAIPGYRMKKWQLGDQYETQGLRLTAYWSISCL